jgi:hypothetical protein
LLHTAARRACIPMVFVKGGPDVGFSCGFCRLLCWCRGDAVLPMLTVRGNV